MADRGLLHIGILMEADDSWLGGVYYFQNLIKALNTLRNENRPLRISLLCRNAPDELWIPGIRQVRIPPKKSAHMVQKLIWPLKKRLRINADPFIEKIVQANGIDFLYPHADTSPWQTFSSAAWIFDFQHKHMPEFFSPEELKHRDRLFSRIAKNAPTIVVSSRSAAKDFQRFFPKHFHKVRVLRFRTCVDSLPPVAEVQNVIARYHLPKRFFMVCNQFWKHKNHLRVLEAVSVLKQRSVKVHVVMTGHMHDYRHPEFQDEILQQIHHLGIHDRIFLLGRISKQDYFQLMRASIGIVQPSLFEGWSSVVEDARALGKTIVLSDIAVHREQNPPQARYFSPESCNELADAMHALLGSAGRCPDRKAEEEAARRSRRDVREFGETFYRIALEAHETQSAGDGASGRA